MPRTNSEYFIWYADQPNSTPEKIGIMPVNSRQALHDPGMPRTSSMPRTNSE